MAASRFLFDQAPEKDIVTWSALISGYVQNGQPNGALRVFLEMESMNVKPDEFILVSLMSASSQLALLDMNAKCGNMERALELFEETPNRDLVSYCSMIQGLSIHGFDKDAVKLFNRMVKEGRTPDEVAFKIILTACSHAGLVDEGWNYFRSMKEKYCISPSPDHYACMGEPHAAAWGALLGECKVYGDSELGEIAAKRLFEIEPQNAANYVLLSNIYAAADRWIDVSLVRTKMRDSRVQKLPGCSQFSPDLNCSVF
ncbi:hypothetical protein PIB30_079619 [Stylosanthes scabra]|uniref:Pentatricopeptide repeat-containing protein n=1 Tax=Stylosanthes scabra TaxID=79078 RepID=A0ABU6RRI6_9FABA|nr:hypothetical protein [Stylosanthes scabra]